MKKRPDNGARVRAPSSKTTDGRGDGSFTIIGVGASAGGLEAFTSLLSHLGSGIGMALVLIQHLDPTHVSLLREALVKTTSMVVVQAEDGMRVLPGHVYVIPPNACLGIAKGSLTLAPRSDDPRVPHLPVDAFFAALAAERSSRAVGVVLSGTGSDGTLGLRAIKDAEGFTFAQDPRSAKSPGMPESAVRARVVDECLRLPELATELVRLSRHPYLSSSRAELFPNDRAARDRIFSLVYASTGVDFSEYKLATLERRIARRMALTRVGSIAAYVRLLENTPAEIGALAEDALIHVTSFFRDPEVFEALRAKVFPAIVGEKPARAPIRVWVPGCATGEEVYSIAIALLDFLADSPRPLQLFGSDVSSRAIEAARAGVFADVALRDLSEERRHRYFTKVDGGYRIVKSVRDLCVFVQHDLARDPPFSKIDLTSCRNVLIYFGAALQKRVVPALHYSLQRPGFLLLGRAESISGFKELFDVVDKANKIFARTAVPSTLRFARQVGAPSPRTPSSSPPPTVTERPRPADDLGSRLDRLLLGLYAPVGVCVNERLEVLEFRGDTGGYLQHAPGRPQSDLLQMARGSLAMTLRAAVLAAKKGSRVRASGVDTGQEGSKRFCDVVVVPLDVGGGGDAPLFLILFEETKTRPRRGAKVKVVTERARGRGPKLEEELAATKEYLSAIISQHGRVNEELGSANEELVSGNEELQSMNEELETAKEELQSINEELTTVNDELLARNHDVVQSNSDLVNLLATVDLPVLMLDAARRIRLFTPTARRMLNVVQGDIGRPFGDIKPNIDVPDLDRQIAEVIDSVVVHESEVQDRGGRWFRLRIRPYKTTDNKIDGAILSLVDIDALKTNLHDAQRAGSEAQRANHMKDDFLATLSHELRTPLSSMLMRVQQLQVGDLDEAAVRSAAKSLEAGVRRQMRLVEDLLDVSRIVAHKLTMYLQPVDLASIVTSTVDELRPAAAIKALVLDVVVSPGPKIVNGDDTRLRQVVTNLLANAIKFTPERGRVSVRLSANQEIGTLTVRDSGIGIEPSFLPTIFDRFTQQSASSTRAYGGLGLGLALVRHLVELHHGTAIGESAGVGKGATFTVTLPLLSPARAAHPPHAAMPVSSRPNVAALHGLRILVVEDDTSTREAIADIFSRAHAVVKVAPSSHEGVRVVEAFSPDVIISDIAMPGEDGYSFIRNVRNLPGARPIRALALTAMAREEDRGAALAAGFDMHLAKPFDLGRLTMAVLELAAMRSPAPS